MGKMFIYYLLRRRSMRPDRLLRLGSILSGFGAYFCFSNILNFSGGSNVDGGFEVERCFMIEIPIPRETFCLFVTSFHLSPRPRATEKQQNLATSNTIPLNLPVFFEPSQSSNRITATYSNFNSLFNSVLFNSI